MIKNLKFSGYSRRIIARNSLLVIAGVLACLTPAGFAQLPGLDLGIDIDGASATVRATQADLVELVTDATSPLSSTLDDILDGAGNVITRGTAGSVLSPRGETGEILGVILTEIGPSDSLVFSDSVNRSIAASSLPSQVVQRFASFQGLSAATRDVGTRLLKIHSGRHLSGSKQTRANEFSDAASDGGGKAAKELVVDDGSWFEFFAQGDGTDLEIDNFSLARSLDVTTRVGTVGVEYHPNDYQAIGLAGSWSETDADLGGNLGSADVEGAIVTLYGSWYDGPFYVDTLVGYGWLDHDISRLALDRRHSAGSTESDAFTAQFNTGTHFDAGPLVTGPYLQTEYVRGEIDPYRESGSSLFNLAVDGQSFDSLTSELGWQIALPIETRNGFIAPLVRAGWDHEYLNGNEAVNARLVSFSANKIRSESVSLEDDYLILGAGLVVNQFRSFNLSLDYEARIADDYVGHAGSVAISIVTD